MKWFFSVCLVASAAVFAVAAEPGKLEFNRDIRPILAENCLACHGPDSASRKADLRLDQRDAAIEMKAWTPNKPGDSSAIARVFSTDPEEIMPPPSSHKKLTAAQKETLKKWVEQGAEYQPHWSFITPVRPPVPAVKNKAWVQTPVDAFILAELEKRGLTPNAEADRRTLIRRVALDLTGLPPAPADVEAAVSDSAPNWYEKWVDKLLASKEWGEQRGRYWLDEARYADTHGIHFDNYREIWAYRDWVINAFNRNLPFDQFTIEQLAGDMLPNRTLEQQVASGFNRCNMTTNEGGIIDEEYVVLYMRDRADTTAAVWLGLSAQCATCHDHKFDPLSQKDYYSFAAFFNNTTQGARDGNIKDTPPILRVPVTEDMERSKSIDGEVAAAKAAKDKRKADAKATFEAWLTSATLDSLAASVPTKDLYLHAPLNEGEGKTLKIKVGDEERATALADSAKWQEGVTGKGLQVQGAAVELADAGDFDKDQPFTLSAWVKLQPNDTTGAIAARMDNNDGKYRGWDFWVQARRVGTHIISAWPDNALKVVAKNQVPANKWTHVTVAYDGSQKASGVKIYYNGELQQNNVESDKLSESTKTTQPFKIGQRSKGDPLSGAGIQDLRIYKRSLDAGEAASLAKSSHLASILGKPAAERTQKDKDDLFPWWLSTNDEQYQTLTTKVTQLEQEQAAIAARGTIAHVMNEKNGPAGAFLLFRGDYDKRRDPVTANTPNFLPPMPDDLPRNRLGLAQWLLRPENPLTARTNVNRFWQQLFGLGIVRSAADLGGAGELPANQELLDWLAIEFREQGWDVKKFFKLLVMSNTYRQSAATTAEKLEKDPQNRYLSRGPRFRMDAEMVRDYALAASGLLVRKIGGASVRPYQPDGVWEAVAMPESNTRNYKKDSGEGLYRRSLYTFWKRAAPPASMEIFNAPNREVCTLKRDRTNTPLQALCTLNDPQFVEAARNLAQAAVKESPDTDKRIDFLARRLLSRPLRDKELAVVKASVNDLSAFYREHEDAAKALIAFGDSKADATMNPADLAAWTMLANELLNLDETLCK